MKAGYHPKITNTFRFRDLKWKPIIMVRDGNVRVEELYRIEGPLCLDESAKLNFSNENDQTGVCPICEKKYQLSKIPQEMRELAHKAYQASIDNQLETISLDAPLQPIKSRDEDNEYWVETKLGHSKDGRKIAIIYIGDKKRTDKVQNFIDLDNEQLRSDRADAKPFEVVSKVEVEFLNSKHSISKK